MITVLYDTPVNLQIAICQIFRTFDRCVFLHKQFWYGLKGGGHNIFKAANLPKNWLKVSKSVIVTGFLFSSFLSTYCTLAEMCCDSEDVFLVDGRS